MAMKKEKYCLIRFADMQNEYLCDLSDTKAKVGAVVAVPVGSDGALKKARVEKIVKLDKDSLKTTPSKLDSVIAKKDKEGYFSGKKDDENVKKPISVTVTGVEMVSGDFNPEGIVMLVPYNKDNVSCVATVTFGGDFDKTYKVFTDNYGLGVENIIVKGDYAYFTNSQDIVKFDLKEDKIVKRTKLNSFTFNTYEFEDGIFVHGEATNTFLDFDLGVRWLYDSKDIFASTETDDIFEMGDGFVRVLDSVNVKHFYDINGEFKIENGFRIKL